MYDQDKNYTSNMLLPPRTSLWQTKWYNGDMDVDVYDQIPALGLGEFMGEWTPPDRHSDEDAAFGHMVGSRINLPWQQVLARKHCEKLAGFGDGPITIRVNWAALEPGLFTWVNIPQHKGSAWSMQHTKVRRGIHDDNTESQHRINDEWEELRPLLTENGIPVDLETIGR